MFPQVNFEETYTLVNIIAKHCTLFTSVYQSVLRSVPGVVASRHSGCWIRVLNTAGPGLFSTSFTSPYKQQELCFNVVEQNTLSLVRIHPH